MFSYTVPVFSGSRSDKDHVDALKTELIDYNLDMVWAPHSAHKEPEKVRNLVRNYNNERIPLITVAGRSDALSATAARFSENPVVASRPDWNDPYALRMFYFSTIGMPSGVSPLSVLDPEKAAGYVNRLIQLRENPPESNLANSIVVLSGQSEQKQDITQKFTKTLLSIDEDFHSPRTITLKDIGDMRDASLVVMFERMDDYDKIDYVLANTDMPVIICPLTGNKKEIFTQANEAFDSGYFPEAGAVNYPTHAALSGATIIGLYNDKIREKVSIFKGI